jgi:DNA-binding transcriptional LysR family regulator
MSAPDLNLLVALDVLLAEGSVAGAARRLRLSPSAMSRTLARLRAATGDPLLARAGRGLTPTPRAEALAGPVRRLVEDARAVLRPETALDLAALARTFTLRTSDGFVEAFGGPLIARVAEEAPGVRLVFLQKPDKASAPLREGRVDLETGVVDTQLGPELRAQALFEDRLVGVARAGHPDLARLRAPGGYGEAAHVVVSRSGFEAEAVDRPFLPPGPPRRIGAVVGGFAAALSLARTSDLVATVPDRHTRPLRAGMETIPVPAPSPPFTVSMLWHPRLDADPAHRWLRTRLREVCAQTLPAA